MTIERATITSRQRERADRLARTAAILAIVWGVATGLLAISWALGGTLGLEQLGVRIQEQALAREPAFVTMIWLSAAGRLLVGVIGAALLGIDRFRLPRRPVLVSGWLAGAGLSLYGVAGTVQAALALAGVIAVPASMGEAAVRWYLFVWEPLWLVGGLALLAATIARQVAPRPARRFPPSVRPRST